TFESWVRSSSPNTRSKKRACACQFPSWVSGTSGELADGWSPAMMRTVSLTSAPLAEIAPVISTSAGGRGGVQRPDAGAGRRAAPGAGPEAQRNGLPKWKLAAGIADSGSRHVVTKAAFRMRFMGRWLCAIHVLDGRR